MKTFHDFHRCFRPLGFLDRYRAFGVDLLNCLRNELTGGRIVVRRNRADLFLLSQALYGT